MNDEAHPWKSSVSRPIRAKHGVARKKESVLNPFASPSGMEMLKKMGVPKAKYESGTYPPPKSKQSSTQARSGHGGHSKPHIPRSKPRSTHHKSRHRTRPSSKMIPSKSPGHVITVSPSHIPGNSPANGRSPTTISVTMDTDSPVNIDIRISSVATQTSPAQRKVRKRSSPNQVTCTFRTIEPVETTNTVETKVRYPRDEVGESSGGGGGESRERASDPTELVERLERVHMETQRLADMFDLPTNDLSQLQDLTYSKTRKHSFKGTPSPTSPTIVDEISRMARKGRRERLDSFDRHDARAPVAKSLVRVMSGSNIKGLGAPPSPQTGSVPFKNLSSPQARFSDMPPLALNKVSVSSPRLEDAPLSTPDQSRSVTFTKNKRSAFGLASSRSGHSSNRSDLSSCSSDDYSDSLDSK